MAAKKRSSKRRYGKKASKTVERAMHKRKRGQLESGRSGKTVKSRKQAIAIGLSEAREKGAKVPPKKGGSKKRAASKKRGGAKRGSTKKRSGAKKRGSSKRKSS